MTADEYNARFGEYPHFDDLHRVNCPLSGEVGHWMCGICEDCDKPRAKCGHLNIKEKHA